MKNFDKMFLLWMDRIVWFILMMVFSNVLVEISGVPAAKNSSIVEQKDVTQSNEVIPPPDSELISGEIFDQTTKSVPTIIDSKMENVKDKAPFFLNGIPGSLFNSIFNIPITTLQTVNTLVQAIIGTMFNGRIVQSRFQTNSTLARYTKEVNVSLLEA